MNNWKSNLGNALGASGSMMVGIGVVPQVTGASSHILTNVALVGFFMNVVGTFFTHLFAQDAKAAIVAAKQEVADAKGETAQIRKDNK